MQAQFLADIHTHTHTHRAVWCCIVSPWRRPPCGFQGAVSGSCLSTCLARGSDHIVTQRASALMEKQSLTGPWTPWSHAAASKGTGVLQSQVGAKHKSGYWFGSSHCNKASRFSVVVGKLTFLPSCSLWLCFFGVFGKTLAVVEGPGDVSISEV